MFVNNLLLSKLLSIMLHVNNYYIVHRYIRSNITGITKYHNYNYNVQLQRN